MTSPVLSSQNVILTTAMAVSGAVIYLSLCRIKTLPNTHQNSVSHSPDHLPSSSLRSCLSSDDKRGEKRKKNKRVKFADNVKEEKTEFNVEKKEKKFQKYEVEKVPEFRRMPANRAALYQGILRDRVNRI
ncbi:5-methyltetrahydropteroyltriglutamate--homocysteine methyltransferase [Bienertia sinuspersici]